MGTEGILRISKELPTDTRSWDRFLRRMNQWFRTDGTKPVVDQSTTLSSRPDTTLTNVLQHVSDVGRANDQRLINTVTSANVGSVQSANPLSATAGATTATISVAAHTLHLDFGDVSYGAGVIAGLTLNTMYYIYTDDPDFSGGAVTYVASDSSATIVGRSGRYFVGAITTPVSANTANISGATSANPIEFTTSAAHGWSSTDQVQFSGLPGDFGAHLNGVTQAITVTGPTKFTVTVDGSTYAAYTSGGTATRQVAGTDGNVGGGGGGYLPPGFFIPS